MATDATNQADLNNTEDTKVTFDEKQQKKVNDLIQEAMGRAGSEARREAAEIKTQLTNLSQELTDAKTALDKAKTTTQKNAATEDVTALEARLLEMQNTHKNVLNEKEELSRVIKQKDKEVQRANENAVNIRKEIALTQAAGKINPFEVEEVVRATKDSVEWDADKNKFIVVDPASRQPRLNASFDPMTIDEFYLEFASKKPYMIKGSSRSGTGSSETNSNGVSMNGKFTHTQIFGPKSNSGLANKLALSDPKEYARLKQMARQDGTIAY